MKRPTLTPKRTASITWVDKTKDNKDPFNNGPIELLPLFSEPVYTMHNYDEYTTFTETYMDELQVLAQIVLNRYIPNSKGPYQSHQVKKRILQLGLNRGDIGYYYLQEAITAMKETNLDKNPIRKIIMEGTLTMTSQNQGSGAQLNFSSLFTLEQHKEHIGILEIKVGVTSTHAKKYWNQHEKYLKIAVPW